MRENDSITQKKRFTARHLFVWLMRYARPYRLSFVFFIAVSIVEIFVGLLAPWSMKIIVDNVLGNQAIPAWLAPAINIFSLESKFSLLVAVCLAGLLVGLLSEFVSLAHTQLQVGIGQKMVLDLQRDLFEHLQKLSLRYHQQSGTGDAIYRLDADAYCVNNIVMSGVFPLMSSLLTLVLMFVILFQIESSLALLSLVVIPPLFLVINRYSERLSERTERVKEMESGIFNLVHEVFSSIKLVKAFSREHYERERFLEQGTQAVKARLHVTLQESLFSFYIAAVKKLVQSSRA
jgi:ABC-type multidrug transport system fused ATPase/permease subunit